MKFRMNDHKFCQIQLNFNLFLRYSRYLVFCGRSKSSSHHDIMTIMENFGFGDWFIIMQLCKQMHPEVFYDLVIDLRNRLDPKHADNMDGNSNLTFTTEVWIINMDVLSRNKLCWFKIRYLYLFKINILKCKSRHIWVQTLLSIVEMRRRRRNINTQVY